jgi:hypothetical protein
MSSDHPPAGWVSLGGVLEPGSRVADYAARCQRVKGTCRAHGCHRRIDLDPKALCATGYGAVNMRRIRDLWRCHQLDGCELTFYDDTPDNPLRLGHLEGLLHVRVRVRCRADKCRYLRAWRAEEMVKALTERGAGDERTEIVQLAGLMKSPCPLCARCNWTVDVLWANTDSVGWRQGGGKVFDRIGTPR